VIILICGKYSKEAGGTIVGVCTGITMSFGTGNIFLLAFYSLGGLIAGVVSKYGKFASFLGFSLSGVLVSILSNQKMDNIALIIETFIAGCIFLILPNKINNKFEAVLSPKVNSPIIDSVKSDIMRKLRNASHISTEICDSLNVVSDALYKNEKADMKKIFIKTKNSVCGSCGLFDVCWKESLNDTQDCFNTLISMKKEGIYLENKTIPQQFASKCIRSEMISSSFNKLYSEYIIKERMETRINEIQTLASEQFVNVSSLLDSLCEHLTEEVRFDMDLAAKVRAVASSLDFEPLESCCVINSLENMSIELKLKNIKTENLKGLLRQIEILTNKKFEFPEIFNYEDFVTLVFKEKADFNVTSAAVQFTKQGEKYSGDTYSTFTDDNGIFYCVICDGMGTGTKAAIGSNLAVSLLEKLIKAGFGVTSAINTVNTSLISKSGDECSVTLDLVAIDLFTGHIEFYKCGAQDTVVRKNKRIHFINSPSLPLGIIKDSEIANGNGTVSSGDVIIMASDGVNNEDLILIENELRYFNNENVRAFTENLSEKIREYQNNKSDDLTLITLVLNKNE
jgi:stage II sporulation protein E